MKEMIQFESQVMVFKFLHLCPHLNHTEPLFQSHFENKLFFYYSVYIYLRATSFIPIMNLCYKV